MNKVRFVGGPFGGRVFKTKEAGRNELVYCGPKKMTRKQQYEYFTGKTLEAIFDSSKGYSPRLPQVEARYRIAMRVHSNGSSLVTMPCMHPDGSLFYEYVKGSKRELG